MKNADLVTCRDTPKLKEVSSAVVTAFSRLTGSGLWLTVSIRFQLRLGADEKAVVTFTTSTEEQPVVMISEEEIRWYSIFKWPGRFQ